MEDKVTIVNSLKFHWSRYLIFKYLVQMSVYVGLLPVQSSSQSFSLKRGFVGLAAVYEQNLRLDCNIKTLLIQLLLLTWCAQNDSIVDLM